MNFSEGQLSAEVSGEVDLEDGILVLKRVSIAFNTGLSGEDLAVAERVREFYAAHCPVAKTLGDRVAVTTRVLSTP